MGLVLFLFTWLGRPSQEEMAMRKHQQDSIAAVQKTRDSLATVRQTSAPSKVGTLSTDSVSNDSLRNLAAVRDFGELAKSSQGKESILTLENDSVKLGFSTKGGFLVSSELKEFDDYERNPIRLIRPDQTKMNFTFVTGNNRVLQTSDLYFEPEKVSDRELKMTLHADNGATLAFVYTLKSKYMLDVQIESQGFDKVLAPNAQYLDMHVDIPAFHNEKSFKTEARYSGIKYEHTNGDVEKLSTSKEVSKDVNGSVTWIAYRSMFFSTVLYSTNGFEGVSLRSVPRDERSGIVKQYSSIFTIPLHAADGGSSMMIYTGPNDYSILRSIDKELGDNTSLSKIVDMGDWFRFINIWLVIPIFNFLENAFSNYGVIILLLTLIIKLLLSPFTYKSYLSTAKMKVLRPQVEEINAKYPGEDKMMERQRATMELYRRAGVSTMGGCLPMLLQMPFLIAMYQYFPTSINLRGQSFLWADDLSTYDDVIKFGFDIPLIGDHISLFCLLMTITQIVYMKISQANTPQTMPGMKLMPYFMSIMLFVFLNHNAAGLSYYYLLSMLITIIQTLVFRYSINEDKLLAKLEANKKKPLKKSKFMQRLEEMQKQQAELQKQQAKKKR